jgi:AcrR family transcriptional regulator
MDAGEKAPLSLRERKKRETRDALTLAVLRLSADRGWGNVTVEDIAATANVSERTFRNYFSSKAEAVAARQLDRMLRVATALRASPPDEPLWTAITSAVLGEFAEGRPQGPQWTAAIRLVLTEPDVQGEILRASATAQRELAAAIAERTGTDVGRDLYPTLMAAATGAAISAAMEQWLRADPPPPIDGLMREALSRLRAGLPVP